MFQIEVIIVILSPAIGIGRIGCTVLLDALPGILPIKFLFCLDFIKACSAKGRMKK
jgi:hypothetical protein